MIRNFTGRSSKSQLSRPFTLLTNIFFFLSLFLSMLFSECNYSVDNYNPNWNTTLHMEHAVFDFCITAHALDRNRENTTEANTRLPINTDPRTKAYTKRGKTRRKKR